MILETENAENGQDVEWHNHVALALKISGSDDLLILDPGVSPRPITKAEYHQMFRNVRNGVLTGFVTCDANTFNVIDGCFDPTEMDEDFRISYADRLLNRYVI